MTAHRTLVITKPADQVDPWRSALEAAQWQVVSIPLLALEKLPETTAQRSIWQNLAQFTGVIVISPMAARWCVEMLDTWWPQPPIGLHWLTPGPGTAQALAEHEQGITLQFPAQGHTTEDLLALDLLNHVEHQHWLIVAGEAGRSTLETELSRRGAQVTRLAVYQRHMLTLNDRQLSQLNALVSGRDVIHVSSQQALESLTSQLSKAKTQSIDLLVSSPRLQDYADHHGWQRVWQANGASLEATLTALSQL